MAYKTVSVPVSVKSYIAGYIDAKSCITNNKSKHNGVLKIVSTDHSALAFIHKHYGGKLVENKVEGNRTSVSWKLSFYGADMIALLTSVSPWLVVKKHWRRKGLK